MGLRPSGSARTSSAMIVPAKPEGAAVPAASQVLTYSNRFKGHDFEGFNVVRQVTGEEPPRCYTTECCGVHANPGDMEGP